MMRLRAALGLAEIAAMAAAGRYLEEHFVPDYNARFAMAAHESPRTTKLYDRTADVITLDDIERIRRFSRSVA